MSWAYVFELIQNIMITQTGIPKFFYGSIAAGVIQRIDRPLLVIRSRKENLEASPQME